MAITSHRFGVLIAAHGERGLGANNESVSRLAAELVARKIAKKISFGFIKNTPTIETAVLALGPSDDVIVYPLFLSDGYFTRIVLARLLEEAEQRLGGCSIKTLPALGFDPGLAELIVIKAASAAQTRALAVKQTTLVLLAHGSSKLSASRAATERLAQLVRKHCPFNGVRVAFLEEPPFLGEIASEVAGPIVVVGLFSGNGLHGTRDVTQLMTALGRYDAVFAGNVGSFAELADLVTAAVNRATPMQCKPQVHDLTNSRTRAIK
jgi:sirohydrochlorin ferrochelatase